MLYQYRIYHKSKPQLEQIFRLTEKQQVHEYSCLSSYLSLCLHSSGITVTCAPAAIELNGVIVDLVSDKSKDDVESNLNQCLLKLNSKVNGLCLVIEKHAST